MATPSGTPTPPSHAGNAEFEKAMAELKSRAKLIPQMNVGRSGSYTRLRLFQVHSLYQSGFRAFDAFWRTRVGAYGIVVCFALDKMWTYWSNYQKDIEVRIKEEKSQKALADLHQQLSTAKKQQQETEVKVQQLQQQVVQIDTLKTQVATLQKASEQSFWSWVTSGWFTKK